jgi:hypothetical protein
MRNVMSEMPRDYDLNKRIVSALRVGGIEVPVILKHIQPMKIQTREQEDELVRKLIEICLQ